MIVETGGQVRLKDVILLVRDRRGGGFGGRAVSRRFFHGGGLLRRTIIDGLKRVLLRRRLCHSGIIESLRGWSSVVHVVSALAPFRGHGISHGRRIAHDGLLRSFLLRSHPGCLGECDGGEGTLGGGLTRTLTLILTLIQLLLLRSGPGDFGVSVVDSHARPGPLGPLQRGQHGLRTPRGHTHAIDGRLVGTVRLPRRPPPPQAGEVVISTHATGTSQGFYYLERRRGGLYPSRQVVG
mmetsp:Transcript_30585/g.91407  ORF Transcript_30585/g.91407 Transcript_30585/m.91407 type:complete len:238 (+) Transcript_30585:921-1634(+)